MPARCAQVRTECQTQLGLALDLAARPATAAALEAGQIDLRKARVILDGISALAAEHAAAVEAAVLPAAPGQTTGQLRNAVTRAVLALDPEAARRRREEAQKSARVECWTDPEGPHLPAGLRRPDPDPGLRRSDPVAALPPLAGSIAVTLPLATLLGLSDNPGEVAGYGPLHGDIVRALANAAPGHPAASWHLIITGPNGQAVGYGYAPRTKPIRGHPADGWTITLTTERIARGCHSP